MNTKRDICLPLIVCIAGLALPVVSFAAESSKDQAQEYIQARKIALKDVHVQDAYKRADEKLDERILEIDPSLKPYVEKRNGHGPAVAAPATKTTKAAAPAKHAATPKPKAVASTAGATHTVVKGDTLSSIAAHYNVSVAGLKSANDIADDRKLHVGQKLVIPSGKSAVKAKPKATSTPAAAKKEPGFWDKLKSDF